MNTAHETLRRAIEMGVKIFTRDCWNCSPKEVVLLEKLSEPCPECNGAKIIVPEPCSMYVKVMVMEHVIGHIAGMRSRENYVSANELFDELFGFIMNCAQEAMNNMDESTVDDVARALEIMDDTMNRPHEPSMKISGPAMTEEEIDALLAEHAKDD